MIYNCCNEKRKAAILNNPALNGINYLEVLPNDDLPQQTLLVHCINPLPTPNQITATNVLITGGESITGITALWVAPASPIPSQATATEQKYLQGLADPTYALVVRVSQAGDFSPYTLRLVNNITAAEEDTSKEHAQDGRGVERPAERASVFLSPLAARSRALCAFGLTEVLSNPPFDPVLSEVQFSFKVDCGPDFDCKPPACDCPAELPTPPAINYLAKDYGSFRSSILDRMNQLLPNWNAGTEADLGVALAELVSYAGDRLSYQQDAVATEAYIQTARSRISLRRHALLVDYHVHDGSNARVWIQLQVSTQFTLDRAKTRFYTSVPGAPSDLSVGSNNEEAALVAGVIAFEPMQNATLYPQHNQLSFYTWGDTNCCLATGATEATLAGTFANLQPGDVLIFQEMLGPQTGNPADADIRHRCAVRLTAVATVNAQRQTLVDPLFDTNGDPITSSSQTPVPVTEIQWSTDDALAFPVCLSSTYVDSTGKQNYLPNVSQAFGNVVLADQGLSIKNKPLPTVPQPYIFQPPNPAGNRCNPAARTPLPVRYRPLLPDSPVTQAVPLPLAGSPVTPNIVPLPLTGYVNLTDSNGFVSLMIEANDASSWPQYFGVKANENALHSGNFDLSVVFNPTTSSVPVILESFPNLTDPAHAAQQLNSLSKFVQVPASFTPPANAPTTFPSAPIMLTNSGTVKLQDNSGVTTYLEVQVTNPATWPPRFGVLAQGNLQNTAEFNLLVVYAPSTGGVGVQTPVLVEEFDDVSLDTVSQTFTSPAQLISVRSFSEEPNPSLSAHDLMNYDASQALPVINLTGTFDSNNTIWTPAPDLLGDGPSDTNFVVEIEYTGAAYLRFGDNINGKFPDSGTTFAASYRIGNGTAGNVGANSLNVFAGNPLIESCTNPLPATGGVDPETNDQIRRRAPQAFVAQERAVTMADYETVTEMNSQVQNAVATLRWTGSWYTVFITAEPHGAGKLTPALIKALKQNINRYRLAGQDIQLESPQYVPLQITLSVCVDPAYFRSNVEKSLQQVLGSGTLPNGQKGLFYPDNFTFGKTVYLSPIYAAARQVAGVLSVTATVFAPQGVTTNLYLSEGEIPLGPFQIAQMANDPSFPNHGQLTLVLQGGK